MFMNSVLETSKDLSSSIGPHPCGSEPHHDLLSCFPSYLGSRPLAFDPCLKKGKAMGFYFRN